MFLPFDFNNNERRFPMFTKVLIAALAVVLCTGGVALAATLPEKIHTTTSTAPQTMLEATEAENIALEAAGLAREQVRFDRSEPDYERGVAVWEIEFRYEYTEYDFEIDAYTGEILKNRTELDDDYIRPPVDEMTPPPATEPTAELTKEQALAIALEHAGLTEEQVAYVKVEKDFDDGMWIYEIEFREGRTEYDYTVRASDGKIVDYDKDWNG